MSGTDEIRHGFWAAAIVPIFIVLAMWVSFLIELELDTNFAPYGLYPRKLSGLRGIITMPFIHGSWSHLINNSAPMLVLGWALYKFYRSVANKSFFWIYIMSGIWLWISARESFHIGASGVVYGLASFLFLSGWLRREKRVAALSLLVAFIYGGLWWGVLPVDPGISWEGHFWGALAGFVLAVFYRKQGPQKAVYQWEIEEELEAEENEKAEDSDLLNAQISSPAENVNVFYDFKPSAKSDGQEADQP